MSFLRNVVGEYMSVLGAKDGRVLLVNADLAGTSRNRGFVERFPDRAFNVGIAEQTMVSFAAGLASEGFLPYAFSMAPFLSMRACEQVRTDVAYGGRSVRLMGIYAGVSGGISGATHWGIEDVGIMTSIPGITVFELSDASQARSLMDWTLEHEGPVYIRITVEPTEDLYPEGVPVRAGASQLVREGDDGAILCAGVVVQHAVRAAERLRRETGRRVRVVDLYSLKPVDEEAILSAAETGAVLAAQDHNVVGGLGSIVSSVLAQNGVSVKLRVLGLGDRFVPMAHAQYLYRQFGLDAEGLSSAMRELWEERP